MKLIKTLLLAGLLSLGASALSGVSNTNLAEAQPCSSSASKEDIYKKQIKTIKDKNGEKSCGLMELVYLDDYRTDWLSFEAVSNHEVSHAERYNLLEEVENRKYIAALKHFLETDLGYPIQHNIDARSYCGQIGSSFSTGGILGFYRIEDFATSFYPIPEGMIDNPDGTINWQLERALIKNRVKVLESGEHNKLVISFSYVGSRVNNSHPIFRIQDLDIKKRVGLIPASLLEHLAAQEHGTKAHQQAVQSLSTIIPPNCDIGSSPVLFCEYIDLTGKTPLCYQQKKVDF